MFGTREYFQGRLLYYFLWGYVKTLVYADKTETIDNLEDNICHVIADIRAQMLEKIIENWTFRLDYVVEVVRQKSYLNYNAERLFLNKVNFLSILKFILVLFHFNHTSKKNTRYL